MRHYKMCWFWGQLIHELKCQQIIDVWLIDLLSIFNISSQLNLNISLSTKKCSLGKLWNFMSTKFYSTFLLMHWHLYDYSLSFWYNETSKFWISANLENWEISQFCISQDQDEHYKHVVVCVVYLQVFKMLHVVLREVLKVPQQECLYSGKFSA